MLAREMNLVAVDFESTGTVPGYPDQPWQVGIVPIQRGEVCMEEGYESYIHVPVGRPFNPAVPGSWRRVRAELASAPLLSSLMPVLQAKLLGCPLVAHNAPTERKFLRKAWPLHRPGPWIDTLVLSRKAFPGLQSHDLGSVVEVAGLAPVLDRLLPGRAGHDALYDAAASALLLCHLLRQPSWRNLSVEDLVRAG